ncbi:hypothetical protein P9B03_18190 [Metasolibacillus meyeri]|uniref:GNAT family N-acetyltransferase n=1 Tax=Metasolibacillus meyeri TaxID=1071052 RepID=A0AAW9NZ23_9BACL|nr:hypothetical protein [Metasolibacillus meyeri]MEC1180430.1 hypothetical protein [Metasolibacillus meyeri]
MEFKQITLEDVPAIAKLLIESEVSPFLKNNCLHMAYVTNLFEEWFAYKKIIGVGAFRIDSDIVWGNFSRFDVEL